MISMDSLEDLRQWQTATESKRCFFTLNFSDALLNSFADFATEFHFSRENAPNEVFIVRGTLHSNQIYDFQRDPTATLLKSNENFIHPIIIQVRMSFIQSE